MEFASMLAPEEDGKLKHVPLFRIHGISGNYPVLYISMFIKR